MFPSIEINSHMISKVMKEILRRQIIIIRKERFNFQVEEKIGYSGKLDDVRTTGDTKSNEEAIKEIMKCFPGFGIISEESMLVPCTLIDLDLYFVIDPLDGSRAYVRQQSDSFGPMIALISGDEVIAAYVGDAMTGEIYGYRPESTSVYRIDFKRGKSLVDSHQKKLAGSWILARNNPFDFSPMAKRMFGNPKKTRLFGGMEVNGGSIGLTMAKVWKGQFSATIFKGRVLTPWDFSPILGISEKLGYIFLEIDNRKKTVNKLQFVPPRKVTPLKKEIMIIHQSNLPELEAWIKKTFH